MASRRAGFGWLLCTLIVWAEAGVAIAASADPPKSGVRLDVQFRDATREHRARVAVRGRRIRVEQWTPGVARARRHVLIYQGDLDRFLSLDPRARAYVAVDRDLITAAGVTTLAARREVDAQIGRLPPGQHAAIERMLGLHERGAPPNDAPITIRPAEGEERVGALTCRRRELVRRSRVIAELCVADWSDVGIGAQDLEVFRQLANFQRELMGAREWTPLELVPDQGLELLVQFDGFPLSLRGVGRGAKLGEVRVTAVEPLVEGPEHFEAPPDYRARSAYSILFGESAPAAGDPEP